MSPAPNMNGRASSRNQASSLATLGNSPVYMESSYSSPSIGQSRKRFPPWTRITVIYMYVDDSKKVQYGHQ